MTGREGRDPRRIEGGGRRFSGPAVGGIEDQYVRQVVGGLLDRILELEGRLNAFTSPSGVFSANLPADVKKSTDTGFGLIPAVEEIADNIGGEGIDTLTAVKVVYASTATVESLEPGESGANVTETRTAALIASQGTLATKSAVNLATAEVTNKTADNIAETASKKWAGETGANVTETRVAASISGQGALATKGSVDLASAEVTNKTAANIAETASLKWAGQTGADVTASNVAASITGQGALATKASVDLASGEVTNKNADNIAETASLKWAGETGANVTETRVAASVSGQGALATKSAVDLATAEVTNKSADNIPASATRKWAAEAGANVTETRVAASVSGQGTLATKSSVDFASAEVTNKVMANISDAGALATKSSIATGDIDSGAVTRIKINDLAINTAKIANGAVDTTQLASGAATNVKCDWGGAYLPNGHADTIGKLNNAITELQAEVVTLGGTIIKTITGGAPES